MRENGPHCNLIFSVSLSVSPNQSLAESATHSAGGQIVMAIAKTLSSHEPVRM